MVEYFTFYLASLDDIFGECGQASLVTHGYTGIGQTSYQDSLSAADRRNRFCERSKIKLRVGPIMELPDVLVITAFHAEFMGCIPRICNTFSAKNAVNNGIFLRINPITEKVVR
jgi:hypothetical protein